MLLALLALPQAPDTQILTRALSHLRAHPLEIVGSDTVQPAVRGHALLDIDSDGSPELFLVVAPKYRQTPTIVVYTSPRRGAIERLYEGLAPGSLAAVSGTQVDTHTLGLGIDMTVKDPGDTVTVFRLAAASRARGFHFVRYAQFFHIDSRPHAVGYVDLSSAKLPGSDANCRDFEFAVVDTIVSGRLGRDTTDRYLAVLTRTDLVIYNFRGITADGRLNKVMWSSPRPAATKTLLVAPDGTISMVGADGTRTALVAPDTVARMPPN